MSFKSKEKTLESIRNELIQRKNYLLVKNIETLYFGGGTPSVLSKSELEIILNDIQKYFSLDQKAEITLEANPDDLTPAYLRDLKSLGINRLSIGIQSFEDAHLQWMNRRHNANQAIRSIQDAQDVGLDNLTIDLIYGLPNLTLKTWEKNLNSFLSLHVPHLSAYHLTIEPKTVLGYHKRKGKIREIDETESISQYTLLTDIMRDNHYQHYEISNFCSQDRYSRHNSNYWNQGVYLGLGPSAHSFDGNSRQWNLSVNTLYIEGVENQKSYFEIERLSDNDKFNDYLLTRLRTHWGINYSDILEKFGEKYLFHLNKELVPYSKSPYLHFTETGIQLTEQGMFLSDKIISELFLVD